MGGAERNARKKKQAARTVVQARGAGNDRMKVIIGVVVVALLAVGVIGYVLWSRSTSDPAAASPDKVTSAPVTRDGGVVVVGKDTAKVTIDVYEDFLCPACKTFEKTYGEQITKELDAGTLKVRYHMLPMLNRLSSPEGYSRDSANAGVCAADAGKFAAYHESLFQSQPREHGPGFTKDQLIKLGKDVGITGDTFGQCVQSGTHEKATADELTKIGDNPSFTGTPSVAHGGQMVDMKNENWLSDLIKNAS